MAKGTQISVRKLLDHRVFLIYDMMVTLLWNRRYEISNVESLARLENGRPGSIMELWLIYERMTWVLSVKVIRGSLHLIFNLFR
jgi:hypothetical protein